MLGALLSVAALGCADKVIPNTDVPDNPENREVIDFMERYRRAVEKRDVKALIAMAAPSYFDDNGTPTGDDDKDYEGLQKQLESWLETVKTVRYEIRYRGITFEHGRILVAFTYSGSFEIIKPDGTTDWSRLIGDHRIELIRSGPGDALLIQSGM